jgi:hypothetical protein
MASLTGFPAQGRLLERQGDVVVFAPLNTTYRLHLNAVGPVDAPAGSRVQGLIRLTARKLWTVPSGGNFVTPIYGPPRIIQGRVRYLEETAMVLHCGTPILVEFPQDDSAFDLANGPIRERVMVNVSCLPGATFELVRTPAAAGA